MIANSYSLDIDFFFFKIPVKVVYSVNFVCTYPATTDQLHELNANSAVILCQPAKCATNFATATI